MQTNPLAHSVFRKKPPDVAAVPSLPPARAEGLGAAFVVVTDPAEVDAVRRYEAGYYDGVAGIELNGRWYAHVGSLALWRRCNGRPQ
jgi:hypothetical protein